MIERKGNTIYLTQGDNLPINYVWPEKLDGFDVYLTIKKNKKDLDSEAVYSEPGISAGTTFSWNVPPSTTEQMEGSYYYDIQISNKLDQVSTPVIGKISITEGVKHGR